MKTLVRILTMAVFFTFMLAFSSCEDDFSEVVDDQTVQPVLKNGGANECGKNGCD